MFHLLSPAAEFFYIYPVVYGVLFCHTQTVHSPNERNRLFFAYVLLLSTSIFCFTLVGYLKISLFLFTLVWAFLILSKTIEPNYKLYAPITGTVLVMSIVLTQRGTQGIFNIALDRFLAIWTMGIIVLAGLHCIPSKLYERVWRKTMIQFLKDLRDYIDALMAHDENYHLDNMCQPICVLENSLNYLNKKQEKLDPRCREDDGLRLCKNAQPPHEHHPRPLFSRHPRASGDPECLYQECFESLHVCYLNLIYLTEHFLIDQTELIHFKTLLNHFLLELKSGNVMTSLSMENYIAQDSKTTELHHHFTYFVARWNKLCSL